MSLNLELLILRGPQDLQEMFVVRYDLVTPDEDYNIYGQLTDMRTRREKEEGTPETPSIGVQPIPPQMWVGIYEDEGLERTREDRFGKVLTFVYAQQFKKLELHDNVSPRMKAIKAFLDALPDDTPIILYWR